MNGAEGVARERGEVGRCCIEVGPHGAKQRGSAGVDDLSHLQGFDAPAIGEVELLQIARVDLEVQKQFADCSFRIMLKKRAARRIRGEPGHEGSFLSLELLEDRQIFAWEVAERGSDVRWGGPHWFQSGWNL
jgi:hypothetical protein